MAILKSKELVKRTRLADGRTTYHTVNKDGRTLDTICLASYQSYEAMSVRMDTFYSSTDKLFNRAYKTIYFK